MVNPANWIAAQWIVVFGFIFVSSLNIAGVVNLAKTNERKVLLLGSLTTRAALVFLLIWGGFFA